LTIAYLAALQQIILRYNFVRFGFNRPKYIYSVLLLLVDKEIS